MQDISPEKLRKLVVYNPDTGHFTWKHREGSHGFNGKFAGKSAFSVMRPCGVISGCVLGKHYLAHRVAWAIYYGEWPDRDIDHINHDRSDNRITNLRLATRSQNQCNRRPQLGFTSRYKGVSRSQESRPWRAQIKVKRRAQFLGRFNTEIEAAMAYDDAAIIMHGQFAVLNFPERWPADWQEVEFV